MTAPFRSLSEFRTLLDQLPPPDAAALQAARARDAVLTKPPGALGRLEDLAIWMAGWQGTARPAVKAPLVLIFAGNHGVAAQGVSAFPSAVTAQMVANFQSGGAAINQLSRTFGARLEVLALDLDHPTADFTHSPALTELELLAALTAGWEAVVPGTDLLVTGDMGIGNTTVAAALAAALFGGSGADWVGRGTGADDAGLALKARVVDTGLARHPEALQDPLAALRCLGGREIAAMAGAIARARFDRVTVILDGFICCAAAGVLHRLAPGALDHAVAGHVSAESAHRRLLAELGKTPLLDLGMRLGEGSGAALAIGVIQGAVACHSGMATFTEAGVSEA